MKEAHLSLTDEAVEELIRWYCREAGVRNLQKHIEKICRKVALKVVRKQQEARVRARVRVRVRPRCVLHSRGSAGGASYS